MAEKDNGRILSPKDRDTYYKGKRGDTSVDSTTGEVRSGTNFVAILIVLAMLFGSCSICGGALTMMENPDAFINAPK